MTELEKQERALLIFCAHALTMSDEYTRFLGQFKFQEKQKFNALKFACEEFVKTIYKNLDDHKLQQVKDLNDMMCDFYYSLINGEEIEIVRNGV